MRCFCLILKSTLCAYVGLCKCDCSWRSGEGVRVSGTGVIGNCEPSEVLLGTELWPSARPSHSSLLTNVSRPSIQLSFLRRHLLAFYVAAWTRRGRLHILAREQTLRGRLLRHLADKETEMTMTRSGLMGLMCWESHL